jgi:putative membrane protein
MRKAMCAVMSLGCLLFATASSAQTAFPANREQGAAMSETTAKAFLSDAAQGGLAEVQLGRLASQKAANAEVKAFAQQMVTDHSKAGEEIKALAAKKNIMLPTSVDAKHKAEHDKLAGLSGAAFDKAYVAAMLADHEKTVTEFKHQATMNQDPDVKAWANKTLPTLEAHLNKVKGLQKSVGTTQ